MGDRYQPIRTGKRKQLLFRNLKSEMEMTYTIGYCSTSWNMRSLAVSSIFSRIFEGGTDQDDLYSQNKFAPLFKQYAGMSFSKYINNLRLEYAAKMLKNYPDYTVDTIAQECGMSTQSFYRLFSGKFGVTPTDFQVGVQHINNKNITEDK